MRRQRGFLTLVSLLVIFGFLVSCASAPQQPAPAPTAQTETKAAEPTKAPEAPTAEPTKAAAPAAEPTKAPEAPAAEPTKAPEAPAPAAGKFNESPMLADLVKAGKLPPVDQRLPEKPQVGLTTTDDWFKPEVGAYGGTMRLVDYDQGSLGHDASWTTNEAWFVNPGLATDPGRLTGEIFDTYEANADSTVFTIHMRKGMKWSDGQPFTSEDVEFWFKDILLNDKLNPGGMPTKYRTAFDPAGTPMTLEVVDDYTFKITFDKPYGAFPANFRYNSFGTVGSAPKHFLKQYHVTYTPLDQLEPKIKEAGFEPGEWWRLFSAMSNYTKQYQTGLPSLTPWLVKSETPTKFTLERNPYYWKVDTAGNQLPYIDKLEVTIVSNIEAATMKIVAGEVDYARRPVNLKSTPLYKQYSQEKGYLVQLYPQHASLGEVFLNLDNPEEPWRTVVQNLKFRQALAMAIDRKQIIDAVYFGLAGLPSVIPINKYDKAQAMKLLDEVGLDKKDADGCRLGPDGKPFIIPWELSVFTGEETAVAEMVQKFWKEVGICSTSKNMDNNLFLTTAGANKTHALCWWAHYPRWPFQESYDPLGRAWQNTYAGLWVNYMLSNGKEGDEPPQQYKDLWALFYKVWGASDPAQQKEYYKQMRQNIVDNNWWIPIVDNVINPVIANQKLGNVGDGKTGVAIEIAAAMEQMYFKK